jgi:hypothetical protein
MEKTVKKNKPCFPGYQSLEIYCPCFPGFHNTLFKIDHGDYKENFHQMLNTEFVSDEKLDYFKEEILYECIDSEQYERDVAEKFVDIFIKNIKEFYPDLVYNGRVLRVSSPNFTNEEIIIQIEVDYKKAVELFKAQENAKKWVKDNFSSRDGFISRVTGDIDTFLLCDPKIILSPILEFLFDIKWEEKNKGLSFIEDTYYQIQETLPLIENYIDYRKALIGIFNNDDFLLRKEFEKEQAEEKQDPIPTKEKFRVCLSKG